MLVTSIFSFSHNVFNRLLSKRCEKSGLCGKGLKTEILFGIGRKHYGKWRKCWLPASPFPRLFPKDFLFRVIKSRDCVEKELKGQLVPCKHQNDLERGLAKDRKISTPASHENFLFTM